MTKALKGLYLSHDIRVNPNVTYFLNHKKRANIVRPLIFTYPQNVRYIMTECINEK